MKMKTWMPLMMIGLMILVMVGMMWLFSLVIGGPSMLPMIMYMTNSSGVGMGGLMLVALLGVSSMVGLMYLMFRWMSGKHGPLALMAENGESSKSQVESKNLNIMTFKLPDVSCQGCKMKVETELGKLPGVDSVVVDVDTQTAEVNLIVPPSQEEIEAMLKGIGYPAA